MRLGTHITGGVLAYTVTATFFQLPWTATGVVVAAGAAALPDVDTLGSTVGRLCAPVARRIERRWGHRTITHCYAAQAAVAVLALPLLWLRSGALAHLYAALVAGYVSHCFLDTLTVQGVRVFWPWSDRRGVFPYYNRQETAYRTRTGSRIDTFFGVGFLCLTVPFAVVQIDGYHRLVRRVQADAGAAVRDFLDWSADGYLVYVAVEASDPQHLRRLSGTFEAVGTTGANTLLVRDTTDGRVFSLGPAYSANFQPDRVVAHRGDHVSVSRRRVDLAGRVLADLEALIPTTSDTNGDAWRARHLLDGQVTLTEGAGVTPDDHRFNTVTGADRRLALQFATLADLDRLGLSGLIVETGVVTVRVFLRDGEAEDYDPDGLARGEVRRVSFAHKPSEPPRLLIAVGDTVAVGDTLAALVPAAAQNARLDLEDARDDLTAVRSERLPAGTDPVALRARLTQAEAAARRVERRHAEGFASAAAVTAARAAAADLHRQLAQAEGRAADWQRAKRERERKARARLRRAEHRAAVAERDTYVRSTGAGVVRRIERRAHGPDRTEVRLVLVAPPTVPTHSTADPPGLSPTAPAASGPRSSLPARNDHPAP